MGDTTRNFSREEFACRCGCGLRDPHPMLVVGLQALRDAAGTCVTVTGPGRCYRRNYAEGGADGSHHMPDDAGYTKAADIMIVGHTLREMYEAAEGIPVFRMGGIGVYLDEHGARLHVDVRRTGPARWGKLYGQWTSVDAVLTATERFD